MENGGDEDREGIQGVAIENNDRKRAERELEGLSLSRGKGKTRTPLHWHSLRCSFLTFARRGVMDSE